MAKDFAAEDTQAERDRRLTKLGYLAPLSGSSSAAGSGGPKKKRPAGEAQDPATPNKKGQARCGPRGSGPCGGPGGFGGRRGVGERGLGEAELAFRCLRRLSAHLQ